MLTTDDTDINAHAMDTTKPVGLEAAQDRDQLATDERVLRATTVQPLRADTKAANAATGESVKSAKDLAKDAKTVAADAWQAARSYAKSASGTAGEKLGDFKVKASERLGDLKVKATEFQGTAAKRISEEPIKAVAIGAAAGALLAAVMLRRGGSRRDY